MDIVERLREYPESEIHAYNRCQEAADEIERLRWALKRISICEGGDVTTLWKEMRDEARAALKESE